MRRVLCGILAFIICSISLVSYCQDNNLQKEQDDLKSKIQKSTDDLGNVKTELSDNMQKVQEIDEKIAASQDEVYKLEAQVNELQGYIDEVQEQLTDAEDRYNTQETALKERLVAMYEAGETKYLDVLLTSKSISEFLSNWYLVSQIAENDSGMLREMGERKDEINGIKQELDGAMEELGNAKKEQVKNQKILENIREYQRRKS